MAARRPPPLSRLPVAVIRVAATGGAFALGVFGFAQAYAPDGGASFAELGGYAYKSLQLIVGQFPDELADKPLPVTLQIARWALPLTTVLATATVAWTQARNTLLGRLLLLRGEHLVVAGDETLAARVAQRERAAGRRVLLWTGEKHAHWIGAAAEDGAPHVAFKGEDKGAGALGLDKARGLLLAGPDDSANVALAGAALDAALGRRSAGDPLTIIARVDDPDLRAPLERRFDASEDRAAARVRFASIPDIAARQLFLTAPLDRFQAGERPARRLYVLGFSPIAERYVLRLLAGAHYRDGGKPEIVVLDPEAERKAAVFHARRPGAAALAPVIFVVAPVDQPSLVAPALDAAIAAHGAPAALLIDPADAAKALPLALAVEERYARRGEIPPPIQVHIAGDAPAEELGAAVIPFGGLDALADPELLLQERLDGLARAIHEFYFDGRLDEGHRVGSRGSMHEWDQLAEAVRDDNRLAADCYRLKLREVGARLLPAAVETARFAFDPDELETLSRSEHDRWMAAKLIDGWVHGEVRDDAARRHPDIVAYDDLSEPRKDLDREQIRVITRLVGASGQRAVRDLVIALEPPAGAGSLDAALTAVRAQYPDRALVLLGDFDDPDVRRALAATRTADAVQLTIGRDPEVSVGRLPRAERGAARTFYRSAERWFALPDAEWDAERRRTFARARAHLRIAGHPAGASDLPTVVLDPAGQVKAAPWGR